MKKSIAAIALTGLLFSLTSCLPEFPDLMVTTEEYQEKTKALLEEKYGEKFEIVCSAGDEATAYPVADPDLLFMTKRNFKSSVVRDTYIQEIVGLQYKKLVEEVLKDFKYDYYLDVDFEFTYDPIDAKQDVTIEEFKKVFPEKVEPNYNWYVSDLALEMSDEELYEWVNRIALLPEQDNCKVAMYFVDDYYREIVLKNYKNYSCVESAFYDQMRERVHVVQFLDDNELLISFDRFKEIKDGKK